MATIGDVWDSTTDVLAGRSREIVPIALGALLLPALVSAALGGAAAGPVTGTATAAGAVGAVVAVVTGTIALWGRLAITAVALDPTTDSKQARAQATRRLLPMIGVLLVLAAAGIVLLMPLVVVLIGAGLDYPTLAATGRVRVPTMSGGAMWFVRLYSLALVVLALWVVARIKLLAASVVLAEGRVIGAIGRAAALTRGMTWRLIGVVVLYYVVLGVVVLATSWVAATVFRLALGPDSQGTVAFLAGAFGAAVGAALDTTAQVFAARLYVALAGTPPVVAAGGAA